MASRFIGVREGETRAASPSTRTVNLSDRSAAKTLKFSTKASSSKLPSTAPAPGYASNPSASRNTFPSNQYYPQQNFAASGLDNVSIASDFDATITSDLGVQAKYGDEERYYNDEEMRSDEVEPPATIRSQTQSPFQHRLQHKQSQPPMIDQIVEPEPRRQGRGHNGSISGRFDGYQPQLENLAVRSFESHSSRSDQGSRKRSRSGERNQPSIVFEERSSQLDNLEDDIPLLPGTNAFPEMDDREDNLETPSNSPRKNRRVQNPPSSQSAARVTKLAAPVPKPPVPDYNDETLKKMAYADLEKEPWEKGDYKKNFQLTKPLRDTSTLQEKLDYYTFKEESGDTQVAFFTQLSLEEWEEGGDWFVEKFTDMMVEMKKKRMEKKQVAKKYEGEISAREKLVRGKSDHLDREFKDMRVGGEGILRGKRV